MKHFICISFLLPFYFSALAQENDIIFTKSKTIQLAPPQLKCGPNLFHKSSTLGFEFDCLGAEIKYAINDGEWKTWTEDTLLNNSCRIKGKVIHADFRESEIVEEEFFQIGHDVSGAKIAISPTANSNYMGDEKSSLIDLKIGDIKFRNRWLGFQSDTVNIKLILNKKTKINSITVHILQHHGAWIFAPHKIEIYSSGKLISKSTLNESSRNEKIKDKFIKVDFPTNNLTTISIKIINHESIPNWHPGSGSKPWLFIDEILLN